MFAVPEEQRRSAERIELKEPVEATLVDVPARIVEISLINCRLEHVGKVAMGSNVTLQFKWRGETIKLKGKLARSEMRTIGGKLAYVSAMQFSDSIEDAPAPLRRFIASLLGEKVEEPPAPAPRPPELPRKPPPFVVTTAENEEEIEEIEATAEIPPARYVRCTLTEGKWTIREVTEPRQPAEGFTMLAPDKKSDIDEFCKTYEVADEETKRMIRLSLELAIARHAG